MRNRANGSAAPASNAFWSPGNTSNGITATRVATGVDADGPWAEYTVVGTATANAFQSTLAEASSRVAAALGQVWTSSMRAFRVAGTAPPANCGARVEVIEETTPSASLAVSSSAVYAGTTPTMLTITRTLNQAGVNQTRAGFVIRTDSGATVNYTIRVQAVQFEQGSARTAYQANFSAFDISETGVPSFNLIRFDLFDDAMVTALAVGGSCDVVVPGRLSTRLVRGVTIAAGQPLQLGPTRLNVGGVPVGPVGLLSAVGDLVDMPLVVNRPLTAPELSQISSYFAARGAGPLVE